MLFAAIVSILIGLLMIGQWVFFLVTRQVPELTTAPTQIAFHLTAEFLTAMALVGGGIGLLLEAPWGAPAALLAHGMLLYTLINSPGHFAQRREWPLVGMFGFLLMVALASLVALLGS